MDRLLRAKGRGRAMSPVLVSSRGALRDLVTGFPKHDRTLAEAG
ncbi:hypothetical protein [Streptomyces sp. NPDC020747]